MIKKILIPLGIVAACAVVAVWMIMQTPRPSEKRPEPPVLLVEVLRAQPSSVNIKVKAQGSVTPRTQTTLVSEVAGMITEVAPAFQVGGFFNKGDVLIRIDDRNYRAELKRAEAAVTSQEMNVTRESGLADYAAEEFERSKSLLTSQSATDLALRKPQLAEAVSNLAFAQADLEKRTGDLERTTIRAPYDGLVREKRVDIGQFVNAGTQLAVTCAVDYAEVRLPMPDTELPYITLPDSFTDDDGAGAAVTLTADLGGTTQSWTAQLVRTEGVFDQRNRVLYVVARVTDPYNRAGHLWQTPLRIGTFVEATIEGKRLEDVIVLPRSVLRADNLIWAVGDDNTLIPRPVTLFRADEDYIYVQSGIDDNELICKTLVDNPLPGSRVRYDSIVDAVTKL